MNLSEITCSCGAGVGELCKPTKGMYWSDKTKMYHDERKKALASIVDKLKLARKIDFHG